MAREKFKTLTEQMIYILLALQTECYGADVMERVQKMTAGRVRVGAGTLYTLLDSFMDAQFIKETRVEGRKRCYLLTETGQEVLRKEQQRMYTVLSDFQTYLKQNEEGEETR